MIASEPALRVIMRRLRDIMSEPGDGQTRLDKIVKLVAGVMVADVCSIYLKRQDGSLELFATEGLNTSAVHLTRMKRGEGLVGRAAELNIAVNEPDAAKHPSYSYRPETGEELYHSLLAVPIQRSGDVLGVLVVQNRTLKEYSDEDVEVLQATAMVVAENLVSGAVAGTEPQFELSKSSSAVIKGDGISDGIALGHVVLHEPRIVVTKLMADDPVAELDRLETAMIELRTSLDEMLAHENLANDGEHRDVLEAYRMFAHDRGWERRLHEAVQSGLTADAAVERVQNSTRTRMLRSGDAFWRERQRDLDDLSDRLLRILSGRSLTDKHADLPHDTILFARSMGAAELLDYDQTKLRGLVVEDGSGQSHVAIVAKALRIAAVGGAVGAIERVSSGDAAIVDGVAGQVHLRPSSDVVSAYTDKVRFRARRQRQYEALTNVPAVTKDGERISMNINAGLLVDMPHLTESGADGVGLFRTELLFMLSHNLPRLDRQIAAYTSVLREAKGKPVVFRSLDIGGDKTLPYLPETVEANPAIGWRAIRMSLDRPALFRLQVRAFMRASAGQDLHLMIPMVSSASEIDDIRALVDKESALLKARGHTGPSSVRVGAMLEVPSVLFEIDQLLQRVDFISVGSNDLLQFMFAADRTNSQVANRYDSLSVSPLRALEMLVNSCNTHSVPLTLCGEMAGRPIEAMVLIGLGFRSLSMAPASIGPVKSMILNLDSRRIKSLLETLMRDRTGSIRKEIESFAANEGIEV